MAKAAKAKMGRPVTVNGKHVLCFRMAPELHKKLMKLSREESGCRGPGDYVRRLIAGVGN